MLGLCHLCLSSAVEVFVTRGVIHCKNCNAKKEEKKEEKVQIIEPEFHSQFAYDHLREVYDKQLLEKIAEDRLFDKD